MAAQSILHGVGVGLVIAAGGTAIGAIAASIVPRWRRISRLVLGDVDRAPVVRSARGR